MTGTPVANALPRLLMLTHRFPYPPNRGDRIRAYHLLKLLSRSYRVTLGCLSDEPIDITSRRPVEALCEEVWVDERKTLARLARAGWAMLRGRSLSEGMFHSPPLAASLRQRQARCPWEQILVFCSSMFPYVESAPFQRAASPNRRLIVDLVDVDSHKWQQLSEDCRGLRRWLYLRERRCVAALERRIVAAASGVTLVSPPEVELFERLLAADKPLLEGAAGNRCPVVAISNGVDTEYFAPPPGNLAAEQERLGGITRGPAGRLPSRGESARSRRPLRMVFTGVLDYRPNVEGIRWFSAHVFPWLRQTCACTLQLVGRRPSRAICQLQEEDGIEVIGEVPDVRPYLHAADLAIAPLQLARGLQNKVLEAMAAGLPVVLSGPAAEGIDACSGQHFWIANTVEQWQTAVTALAACAATRQRLGEAARRRAVERYDWSACLGRFLALLADPSADPSADRRPPGQVVKPQQGDEVAFQSMHAEGVTRCESC